MTPLNLIFKVVSNDPEREQLVVKFCRQNARESIDSYEPYALDYLHLDFNTPQKFVLSVLRCLMYHIEEQVRNEPILEENSNIETIDSVDINDYVNKIVGMEWDDVENGIFDDMDYFDL
jgi:hypothetical protein